MADEQDKTTESKTEQSDIRFDTVKVYLKDASFEAPSTPKIFTQPGVKPKNDVQVLIDYRLIEEESGIAEIVLKITVTSKHEDNVLYLAEVHQAGLFRIQHPNPDTRQIIIEVTCPHLLLPFAREELNNLITKGGFGSFLLSPINFETLYTNKKKKEMDSVANATSSESVN